MLGVMRERGFPADEVVAFASERSVGREIDWGDKVLSCNALSDKTIQGFDIALFSAGEAREVPAPNVYPHQIAFNVLPHAGSFPEGSDYTDEELKLVNETRKILGQSGIGVSATCTRVPVYTGHSESVNVQTREPLSPEECRELPPAAPGVEA